MFSAALGNLYRIGRYCAIKQHALFSILFSLSLFSQSFGIGEVVWAVNCGGEAHTDIHGIRFEADPLQSEGISSDYGKNLMIQRVVPQDQILYQTERYHVSKFGYDIPLKGDGDYVLVLKFCEVWFTAPNQKVFDISVNGEIVISELDIFSKVGRGVAHDEYVQFSIHKGTLKMSGEVHDMKDGKIRVEFLKGDLDNPKINALYLMRGTLDDVPKLPALPGQDSFEKDEEEEEEEVTETKPAKSHRPSGPKVKDPYAADDTSTMLLPVFIAVGAFIPLLFCLCKL
ncbi:hypothetical protein ACJMK2_011487 [Sinanodonta woodiana]|uniref:Malectin domain-containing protein n=1 Tax=Sinanodonta woodiana TaxID=1069815 RepID=A0ABD3V580_SINWO